MRPVLLVNRHMQRQFLPASVIHDAAETLASAVLDPFEVVYRKRGRHVADEPYGDHDPQMGDHALEDDLTPAQYMMAFASSTMYTPGSPMRVDLRAGLVYAVALSRSGASLRCSGTGLFEIENFCSFHGEFLLSLGNLQPPSFIQSIGDHLWGRKDAMFGKFNRQEGLETTTESSTCESGYKLDITVSSL